MFSYKWDGENRLIIVSNIDYMIRCFCDCLGRWVMREENGIKTTYLYDEWNLLYEANER